MHTLEKKLSKYIPPTSNIKEILEHSREKLMETVKDNLYIFFKHPNLKGLNATVYSFDQIRNLAFRTNEGIKNFCNRIWILSVQEFCGY